MILFKIILTIFVTSILIFISEKNPRVGGLISGLPIGTGIVVIFYSLEYGEEFVLKGIPYGILGLVSSLLFCLGFYIGGRYLKKHKLWNVILAFSIGFIFFFSAGILLNMIDISLLFSIVLLLSSIFILFYFFSSKISKSKEGHKPLKKSYSSIIFRVVFVTVFVVSITNIAGAIGEEWSGILASFPTGLSPVLMVICWNYNEERYLPIIKYFTLSITTLLIFYLLILFLSVNINISVAYFVCFLYVFILHKISLKFNL